MARAFREIGPWVPSGFAGVSDRYFAVPIEAGITYAAYDTQRGIAVWVHVESVDGVGFWEEVPDRASADRRLAELYGDPGISRFDEFHGCVMETLLVTDSPANDVHHMAAGLAEEAGEVLGKFKRLYRGDYGAVDHANPDFVAAVRKEIGDLLWYSDALAHLLGTDLSSIATETAAKLRDRKARGVLKGSGDNR